MKFAHNFFQGRAITMDCQDYITELDRTQEGTALTARGTRRNPASQERRLHEQSHCQGNRMFTNHRWERAKARHTAPKEQQGQEARILGKAWRSGLQGEQKAFSETTPNLSLHSLHSLDNGTGQKNTSGLWMPASAMLVCTGCFQQRRWSAPTRFTMRSGQAALTCL